MKNKLAAFTLFATAWSAIAQSDNTMTPFGFEIGRPLDLPVASTPLLKKL